MDTAFFILSKAIWWVIAPDSLLLLLVLAAWILLLRNSIRAAKVLLSIASIAILLIACLPVGGWLLHPLEMRFAANPPLPQRVDGIIVLGGPEDAITSASWNQVEVNDAAERFLASVALARRFPHAKLVFTSGSGSVLDQRHKGSVVARRLYEEQGLDTSRMLFESESRNTVENATLSKALVKPAPGDTWLLVTSAFHMPRSIGIFCKIGWPAIAYPVDHRTLQEGDPIFKLSFLGNLESLSTGIKEWVGLAAYYLTGRTTALVPKSCAN